MKCIKNIFALVLTLALVLSTAAVPVFAEKLEGAIVGDCTLFLPDTDAIKVTYNLVDENGADVTDNVTYSVTSTDATWEKWLDVDAATGDVYVSSKAAGKSFTVTAESDTYKKSQVVNISETVLCADFEDEEIGTTVTDDIFSIKTATVVANGEGKAASSSTSSTTDLSKYGLVINSLNFVSQKYTIEANAAVPLSGSNSYFLAIKYKDISGSTRYWMEKTSDTQMKLAYKGNSTTWSADGRSNAINYTFGEYINFKLVISGNKTGNFYWNNVSQLSNKELYGAATETFDTLETIAFGSLVDDIKIYTGERVSHAFKTGLAIEGESSVLRAPSGTSVKIPYELAIEDASIAGETLPTDVLWSVSSHSGVSVADATKNEITVSGDATAGTFTVTATDSNGTVWAKKDVKIINQLTSWSCANSGRAFCDMESATYFAEGASPTSDNKSYSGYTVESTGLGSVVKVEKDTAGNIVNRYISSMGYLAWSGYPSLGSGARIRPYDWQYSYASTNSLLTFEGKFMIESDVLNHEYKHPETTWSLLCAPDATATFPGKAALDLRYDDLGEGVVGIYIHENGAGYNGEFVDDPSSSKGKDWVNCSGKLIALVGVDEWFDLRVEADYTNEVYNIWIDDVLVAKNIATGESRHFRSSSAYLYSGAAFDDIALYTGAKDAETVSATEQFTVFKDFGAQEEGAMGFTWSEATPDKQTSSASASLMSNVDYSGKSLIAAIYSADNSLVNVKYVPVAKTTAGNSIAFVNATGVVPANGFAKIFLWDMGKIVPVK